MQFRVRSALATCVAGAAALLVIGDAMADVIKRHPPSRETSTVVEFVPTPPTPASGEQVDIAPFGEFRTWDEGRDIGVLWEDMRDLFRVVVVFAEEARVPAPEKVKLQYWQSQWPYRQLPRTEVSGSGESGWLNIGDWFKGAWKDADADLAIEDRKWSYTFRPANVKEYPELPDFKGVHRSTFKLRLLFPEKAAPLDEFHAYTDSTWDKVNAVVEWGGSGEMPQVWDGKAEAFNGHVEQINGTVSGVKMDLWYARPVSANSFDDTVITLRCKRHSFSFAPKELAEGKRIFVRDYGVLVRNADEPTSYAQCEEAYQESPKDVYRRIEDMPEQTLGRAWSSMPPKNRIYLPLCVEGGRQYFRLHPNGDIMHNRAWLNRVPSTDTPHADWPTNKITVRFGIPQGQRTGATLEDGYLPIGTTWWEDNGVRVTQTAFATTLSGELPDDGRAPAEEPQLCLVGFTVTNTTDQPKTLRLPMRVDLAEKEDYETLVERDGLVFAKDAKKERLRFYVECNGAAQLAQQDDQTVACAVATPARESRTFYVAIPFLTPNAPEEIEQLKRLDFDEQRALIGDYWRERTFEGTVITTPDPMLNEFYQANASHQLINTQCEAGTPERAIANVGTGSYGIFPNESIMMISELDRRGYHDVAEQALETFIHYQGTKGLPGDFSSDEGVLFGAGGYEEGGYNQHQGWVLWGLAEHYWFTRDSDWLDRVAPSIVKGCDWIINERKRTISNECVGIREIERGLLPQGNLEDINDWGSWLSNNVFSYWGLENAAHALADADHPDGKRLLDEAAKYKKDVLGAFEEAMVRSPVVGLRDGTYVPYVPAKVHRRGRSYSWISETLEGGIHLIRCGLVEPDSDIATWTMKDYEDNRYISERFGYQTPYFERDWFSLGGFSQQPSLLCSPTPYLMRDEPKHYVRSYFNCFAAGYFPERAMLTEHPLPNLGNWRGGHFKSSDEAMNTSWLRWMFIWDEGDDLYLGKAIPRYWLEDGQAIGIENAATHFGPMSMSMRSRASEGRIEMTIEPPTRNRPGAVYARFRHPEGMSMNRVTVNGKPWNEFDPEKEWVILPPLDERTVVAAYYD